MSNIIAILIVGQSCVQQPVYQQPVYQQPVYQQPVYQQAYAQFVAVDIIGQEQRNELRDAREIKIDQLLSYIEKLTQKSIESKPNNNNNNNNDDDPPIYSNPNPNPNYQSNESVPPPPSPIPLNKTPDNVSQVFKTSCVKCHSNPTNAKLNLFTQNGQLNTLTPKDLLRIDFAIRSNRMPKKGGPLSDKDKNIIYNWILDYEEAILISFK